MNYSNKLVSAFAMLPTILFVVMLISVLPIWLWFICMLIMDYGSAKIYSVTVQRAERLNQNPRRIYMVLFIVQILFYGIGLTVFYAI